LQVLRHPFMTIVLSPSPLLVLSPTRGFERRLVDGTSSWCPRNGEPFDERDEPEQRKRNDRQDEDGREDAGREKVRRRREHHVAGAAVGARPLAEDGAARGVR